MPYKNNKRHSKYFWNNRLGLIWFGSVWMCDCDHISSFNSLLFSITIGITAVISIKLPNWMGLGIAISNNRYELLGKEEKIGFFLSFTWNHLPIILFAVIWKTLWFKQFGVICTPVCFYLIDLYDIFSKSVNVKLQFRIFSFRWIIIINSLDRIIATNSVGFYFYC